jgi:pyruvate formate lyase activating enzyme
MIDRRDFIRLAVLTPFALRLEAAEILGKNGLPPKEALYYQKLDEKQKKVWCQLCPRGCTVSNGESGFCRARKNIDGKLYSLGYAEPCAIHIDPIEKKPFFNVLPKTLSLSIASAGCNLRCKFCQNWQISQVSPQETANKHNPPQDIVAAASKSGSRSIAYTYTEPTNFFEYMLDVGKIAKSKGMINVQHSNGYINPSPLKELCQYLDAVNIDLKGFSKSFYNKVCEAELEPVLETIKTIKSSGVWVEITNLIIPGHNDDIEMIKKMCEWIKTSVGVDVPVDFSRFYPMYKMTSVSPTPVSTLERARATALNAGLQYAYIGNVPGHPGENTYCPQCKKMIIKRSGYNILENQVKNGKCPACNGKIAGIWSA